MAEESKFVGRDSSLDGLSLEQALRDFEVANARVLDLSRRLMEAERQKRQLMDELERMRIQMSGLEKMTLIPRRGRQAAKIALDLARLVSQRAFGGGK